MEANQKADIIKAAESRFKKWQSEFGVNPKLSTKQAADYLGLAEQTLANWRFLRQGPVYSKLGRRIVYQIIDLDAYLQQNRIQPEAV